MLVMVINFLTLNTFKMMVLDYNSKEEMLNLGEDLKENIQILSDQMDLIKDKFALVHFGKCVSCSGSDAEIASLFIKNAKYVIKKANFSELKKHISFVIEFGQYNDVVSFPKKLKNFKMNQFLDESWGDELVKILINLNEIAIGAECLVDGNYKKINSGY